MRTVVKIGAETLELDLPCETILKAVLEKAGVTNLGNVSPLVNGCPASLDAPVKEGDTVKVLPKDKTLGNG